MSSPSSSTSDGLPRRAVFLSYAREDSPAAQRVTDALRSSGIEVWFDQSELRGGDVWDQKIRRQIRECTLFMPIISERTQSRGEGYFRLEWKLAVERTHLMAEGVPFLTPVVVDTTVEGAAIVPPEFLRVQWTRLPSALPTPQFVEQVQRLLEPAGRVAPVPRATGSTMELKGKRSPHGLILGVAAVVAAILGTYLVVKRPGSEAASVPPPAAPVPAALQEAVVDPKSIAVLPFDNMSEDKDNAFFTDGVHEDVLTNLSFIKDLHVVSRTSVMQYRGTTKPIKTIGHELGVAYILEGSVRREGNKVRVTGQLIDARTDQHLWAKAYDRDLNDIFAIQGELAQSIADALQAVLDPQAKELLARKPTENTQAYDDYVKARQLRSDGSAGAEFSGTTLLEEAVKLDPNFAQAWAELGAVRAFKYFGGGESDDLRQLAKQAIDTAVRLAPDDPAVIEGEGDYYYYAFRDYARSTEQYMRLAAVRPNDAIVFSSLGLIQRRQGRFGDAIPNFRRAVSLDPTNQSYHRSYVDTLVCVRLFDEAQVFVGRVIAEHPENILAQWTFGQNAFNQSGSTDRILAFRTMDFGPSKEKLHRYLMKQDALLIGDWEEFVLLDKQQRYYDAFAQDPSYNQDAYAAEAFAEMGDMASARQRSAEALPEMNKAFAKRPDDTTLLIDLAGAYALLGQKDEALANLKKAEDLLPESRDAISGTGISMAGVYVLAWVGEKERALAELERLLHVPFGANIHATAKSLRPLWDMPRFKELVSDPKNNEPIPL